jgi:nicotinate-nucleotide adenylyltransferase
MTKIGLLGGTFDPIHFGHINLAFELMEKWGLDKIWFIPARHSPLKPHCKPAAEHHRLMMLRHAIQGIPQFEIQTCELERTPPSYTVDTIRQLLALNDHHQFFLLLGEDLISSFLSWKEPREIVRLVPILVGSRALGRECHIDDPMIDEAFSAGWTKTCLLDISGTEIRHRLGAGLYCGHLVPAPVLDYIHAHHLYQQLDLNRIGKRDKTG